MGKGGKKADVSIENLEKAAELTAVFIVPFILALFFYFTSIAVHSAINVNPSVLNNSTKYTENQYYQYTNFFKELFNNTCLIVGIISVMLAWFFLAIYYLLGRSQIILGLSIFFQGIAILSIIYLMTFSYSNFLYNTTSRIIFGVSLIVTITYWCLCICAFSHINNTSNHKSDLSDKQLTNVTESKYSRGSGL